MSTSLGRILQRLPIILHSGVLVLAIFGPWYFPSVVAALFFVTNMGFVFSQVRMAYGMIRCYWAIRTHWKTDWWAYYIQGLQSAPVAALETRYSPLTLPQIIIVPSYKETMSTLRQTLAILASHPLAPHTYKVCLAMEQREEGARRKGQQLAEEFAARFLDITVTIHPGDIPDEVPGKGSNTRWAARWMAEREMMVQLDHSQTDGTPASGNVEAVMTIMDADTAFAADYFLAVAVRYLLTPPETRCHMMFVPPILFDRNQADVPAVTRVTDIMWSTAGISGIYPGSTIRIPTSAYSISMALAIKVGFWDAGPQAIGEDMHMFLKSLFDTKGHLHVETIYSPASQCNVVGSKSAIQSGHIASFFSDCNARWQQAVRHMWGSLDTGYVANRFISKDFGVSASREIEHRLARVEMRQRIIDVAAEDSLVERKGSRSGSNEDAAGSKRQGPSVDFTRRVIVPPKWLRDNNGSPTFTSDDDEISTPASSASSSTRGRPAVARDSSISSHYSYSSADEDLVDQRKTTTTTSSSSRLLANKHHTSSHAHTYPRSSSSSASTSASIASPQNIKVFPFVVVGARMYEAHIMLAHLFILLNALIVIPKLTIQLDAQLASQSLAWGRAAIDKSGAIGAGAVAGAGFFSTLTAWSTTNGILPQTISICNKLGAIGALSTVVTFLFHDLYHREAGKRWTSAKTATRLSHRVTPSTSSAHGKDSNELEAGLLSRSGGAGLSDSQPPFDQFDLGIPPAPHSVRRIPWCFLDYLAVPGGLVFGVAPLLYAQVCHLWTDRLAYKVSAKPQAGPAK